MFRLRIKTDDDEVSADPSGAVSALLSAVAYRVAKGETEGHISDGNGNSVGAWKFTQRNPRKISVYGKE